MKLSFFIRITLLSLLFVSFISPERLVTKPGTPLVSILTSIWSGDEFIKGFLVDITRQTIFKQCELILINANSPGNEEAVIRKYMKQYPNIIYKRLTFDPGLYGTWNIAIKISKASILANANLDDRMAPTFLETHLRELQKNPNVDLVYSDSYWTNKPNETFEDNSATGLYPFGVPGPEFSKELMRVSLPACHPVWRKAIHTKHGLFDSSFKSLGDHEMWLRAVKGGSIFKKVPGVHGLFYTNPKGLSTAGYNLVNNQHQEDTTVTDPKILAKKNQIHIEHACIVKMYPEFFN